MNIDAVLERPQVRAHTLSVMDRTGDTKTIWNPDSPDEVEAARETFKALRKKGFLVYRVNSEGSKGKAMTEFDPAAEKMIAVPAVVGG